MPSAEQLLFNPAVWGLVPVSATNGVATCSIAGAAGAIHFVTGYSISFSGLIAAATTMQVKSGTTVIDQLELPGAVLAPIIRNYTRPLKCAEGALASITVGALGTGIVGTAVLFGFTTRG